VKIAVAVAVGVFAAVVGTLTLMAISALMLRETLGLDTYRDLGLPFIVIGGSAVAGAGLGIVSFRRMRVVGEQLLQRDGRARQAVERARALGRTLSFQRLSVVAAVVLLVFDAVAAALSFWNVLGGGMAHQWRLTYLSSVPLFVGLLGCALCLLVASWAGGAAPRTLSLIWVLYALLFLEVLAFLFLAVASVAGALLSSHDEHQIAVGGTTVLDVFTSAPMVVAVAGAGVRLLRHLSPREAAP
jgi:hypothetical protein